MTLPTWMYRDPSEIVDRVRVETEKEVERLKVAAERLRIKKARRIRKLVKQAKRGERK